MKFRVRNFACAISVRNFANKTICFPGRSQLRKLRKLRNRTFLFAKDNPDLNFFEPDRADSNIFINSRLEKNNSANKILKFEKTEKLSVDIKSGS